MPSPKFIGLDIGGTKIYAARYNHHFEVEEEVQVPTEADKGRAVVFSNITRALQEVIDANTSAIGIAWAGFVDPQSHHIMQAPNIPNWVDVPLANDLKYQFDLPVFIENDARLFTLAEQRFGQAKGLPNVIGLIIGTGVGSGIVINNEIYSGINGYAGEIGHLQANIANEEDQIQIEELFAGPHLERYFREVIGVEDFQKVHQLCASERPEVRGYFDVLIKRLASFLYNITLSYNPNMIVLGGGIGKDVISNFHKKLSSELDSLLKSKNYPLEAQVRFSQLKNSGALGAAIYAKDQLANLA